MANTACVIGCGVSGLVAAIELIKRGNRVTIFELTNRIGGRVWTETLTGEGYKFIKDNGAAYVHGVIDNPIGEYIDIGETMTWPVREQGIFPDNKFDNSLMMDPVTGEIIEPSLLSKVYSEFRAFYEANRGTTDERSWLEVISQYIATNYGHSELEGRIFNLFAFFLEDHHSFPSGEIPICDITGKDEMEDHRLSGSYAGPQVRVRGGMGRVVARLVDILDGRAEVAFNSQVVAVTKQGDDSVVVKLSSGEEREFGKCVFTGSCQAFKSVTFTPSIQGVNDFYNAAEMCHFFKGFAILKAREGGMAGKGFCGLLPVAGPPSEGRGGLMEKDTEVLQQALIAKLEEAWGPLDKVHPQRESEWIPAPMSAEPELPAWGLVLEDDTNSLVEKEDGMFAICVCLVSTIADMLGDLYDRTSNTHLVREAAKRILHSNLQRFLPHAELLFIEASPVWAAEKGVGGAYTGLNSMAAAVYGEHVQVGHWDGLLSFGGEGTDLELGGSVHGAITQGKRAVANLDAMKKND